MANYRPAGDDHAIDQAIVGVRLKERADETHHAEALKLATELAVDFKLPGRMQLDPMSMLFGRQNISFGYEGQSETLGGHLFQHVNPDGTTSQELTLEPTAVTFRTMAYERWSDIQKIIREAILPITTALTGGHLTRVSVVELRCIDRFVNDGPDKVALLDIIAKRSSLLPSFLEERTSSLHSHIGWFDDLSPNERYLYNLNVGVSDTDTDQTVHLLQVVSRHLREGLPEDDSGGLALEAAFDDLHARDKGLLEMLLNDAVKQRINLAGRTTPVLP